MIRSATRAAARFAARQTLSTTSTQCLSLSCIRTFTTPSTSTSTPSSSSSQPTLSPLLSTPLHQLDPAIHDIIEREKQRQRDSLALIPSENFTSTAVLSALGSVMQNKYSEGYPRARYYGGNEFIDMAEELCQARALELYKLDPERWGVNVQPHSGSPANFYGQFAAVASVARATLLRAHHVLTRCPVPSVCAVLSVYTAVLGPHERMMALDLPHGGHLSHGYASPTKKVSAVSIYFEVLPYRLDEHTGLIDYDALERNARLYRPKLLVTGASAYSRHIDYGRMRRIADVNKSLLMVDMAHISGLVAAGVMPSPFDHADIVTTTTHKSLRGPRGAMIFYRKGARTVGQGGVPGGGKKSDKALPASGTAQGAEQYDLEEKINAAVFPGHQGGPHNHTITALAVALKQAATPEFRAYQEKVLSNNAALANYFLSQHYTLVSGGTDNHLLLLDLRPLGINGGKVEHLLSAVNIAANKNTVPGDSSAMNPGGLRLGSPALTSRGLTERDFTQVGALIHEGVELARALQKESGVKLVDYKRRVEEELAKEGGGKVGELKRKVTEFARRFPAVGFEESEMKYKD